MYLTKTQSRAYEFLKIFIDRNGFAPNYEEIASGLKLKSIATVHKHITNLERLGYITRAAYRARSIEIVTNNETVRFEHTGPDRLYDRVLKCFWVKEIVP